MKLEFMKKAIEAAKNSGKDIPIGCVIVKGDEIISFGINEREKTNKISAHAEITAIEKAQQKLNSRKLDDCEMYVTLEPCPMCAYAIMESHIKRLVYGTIDPKRGAISTLDIFNKSLGSKVEVCGNIEKEECESLLKEFFKELR